MDKLKVLLLRLALRLVLKRAWRNNRVLNVSRQSHKIPVADGEIEAYVYEPDTVTETPLPAIIYFHGGGFVAGDIKSSDPVCRDLCENSEHVIISVDYRLAPEHRFPIAPNDCLAAFEWVVANAKALNIDPNKLNVCGDSAGGNLAAVVAIQARKRLKGQILIYPVTNHSDIVTKSYLEHANGKGLTRRYMKFFWRLYLKDNPLLADGEIQHDLATPMTVDDLSGLPPALVITAQLDPLRDEGIAYAKRMAEQGVEVQETVYQQQLHGFFSGEGPDSDYQAARSEIIDWLKAR